MVGRVLDELNMLCSFECDELVTVGAVELMTDMGTASWPWRVTLEWFCNFDQNIVALGTASCNARCFYFDEN